MRAADYIAPVLPSSEPLTLEFRIPEDQAGMRLDAALAALMPKHSRSRIRSWIDAGRVSIAGTGAQASRRLSGGERVRVEPPPEVPRAASFVAQALALDVVYEDSAIVVLDKPAGLVVHPGSGNRDGTLANALVHRWPDAAAIPRAGIVHRLDKDTSGLMVVARTLAAQTDLVRQLQARTVRRIYLALVEGDVLVGGTVDAPIGRHPVNRTSMAVVARGKAAVTHFSVRERFGACTLLECRLETGRTHQIRVHCASLGHPVVGDPAYGRRRGIVFGRQALHAAKLELVHPEEGRPVSFKSRLPDDFAALLQAVRGAAA